MTFPEHFQKSLPNLIDFVLHYASLSVRLSASLTMCTQQCFDTNLYSVTARVAAIGTHISRLQHRVSSVKAHLQNLASGSVSSEDTALTGVHTDVLHQYLLGLKTRLRKQHEQLVFVRRLYDILMQNNGDLVNDKKFGAFIETWRTQRTELKGNKL